MKGQTMRLQRHTSTMLAALAAAAMAFGCAYDYGDGGLPDEPGEGGGPEGEPGVPEATNLNEALAMAQAADEAVRANTAEVLAKGAAMEAAGLLLEADLAAAEATGSLADLEKAVADGRVALMDASLAEQAGDRIAENLRVIVAVTGDSVGLLAADPGGAAKARQVLALALDADNTSQAAIEAFDTAELGLDTLLEEFAVASSVAAELGADGLALQLETEAKLAEELEESIAAVETRIGAMDASIEAAALALEEALGP